MDAPNRMTPKASWTWCVSQFGVVSAEEKTFGNLQRASLSEMPEKQSFSEQENIISKEKSGMSGPPHFSLIRKRGFYLPSISNIVASAVEKSLLVDLLSLLVTI